MQCSTNNKIQKKCIETGCLKKDFALGISIIFPATNLLKMAGTYYILMVRSIDLSAWCQIN